MSLPLSLPLSVSVVAVNRSGVGKIELLGTGTRFKGAVNACRIARGEIKASFLPSALVAAAKRQG